MGRAGQRWGVGRPRKVRVRRAAAMRNDRAFIARNSADERKTSHATGWLATSRPGFRDKDTDCDSPVLVSIRVPENYNSRRHRRAVMLLLTCSHVRGHVSLACCTAATSSSRQCVFKDKSLSNLCCQQQLHNRNSLLNLPSTCHDDSKFKYLYCFCSISFVYYSAPMLLIFPYSIKIHVINFVRLLFQSYLFL